jgi:hypothetical protein
MNGGGAIVAMIKYYLSNYPDSFRRIFVINGIIHSAKIFN